MVNCITILQLARHFTDSLHRMQKLDRLLSIVLMLHAKRVVRAEELARHFGVSPRTIYRDVNTLCQAGVPVASEAGVGYSLVRGYHLPPVMFTDEEASAVVIGTEFLRGLSALPELTHNAVSAVAKILSILPDKTKERIHHMQETTAIRIVAGDSVSQTILPTIFTDLQRAIAERRVVHTTYFTATREEQTERDVEPLGMVYYSNNWHCIAYCRLRKEIRDFRADRFRQLLVQDEQYKPHLDFRLLDFLNKRYTMHNPVTVKVLFDRTSARFVRNKMYYGWVEEENTVNGVIMTFFAPGIAFIGRWLLAYADRIKIIEPPELRTFICEVAEKALRNL